MKTPGCFDCRYWQRDEETPDRGECAFHPPVIVECLLKRKMKTQDGDDAVLCIEWATRFPVTSEDDWCGHHLPHPTMQDSEFLGKPE